MAKKRKIESTITSLSSPSGISMDMERVQQHEHPVDREHVAEVAEVAEISSDEEIESDNVQVQRVVQETQEDNKTMATSSPWAARVPVVDDLTSAIKTCRIVTLSKDSNTLKAAGEYFHNFHNDEPPIDEVTKVLDIFPEALLYKDDNGHIPIQTAVQHVESVKYVPLLSERTIQMTSLNTDTSSAMNMISGERPIEIPPRGGLLLPYANDDPECNILQYLVTSVHDEASKWYDERCIQALKDLTCARLLTTKDCVEFNLIGYASATECLQRLEYLTETFSTALATPVPVPPPLPLLRIGKNLPIHVENYCDSVTIGVFATILKCGMKHYPESFGFMFKKNMRGERAILQAMDKFGKQNVLQCIRRIIPPDDQCPILHHVIRYTPDLFDDFFYTYPDGIYLKDHKGRLLLHVALKSGLKLSPSLMMMIHSNKECLDVKDPVTNLYPFMLAASRTSASKGRKRDLTTLYKLISLRPEMIEKCIDTDIYIN